MSKSKRSSLHALIQKLTKSEKRYFKVYASGLSGLDSSNYVILFDLIESLKVYSDSGLYKIVKGKVFEKHLASTKYQLQKLILKTLRQYHESSTVDIKMYEYMTNAGILMGKMLYADANSHYEKVIELGQKHERYNLVAEAVIARIDCLWLLMNTRPQTYMKVLSESFSILEVNSTKNKIYYQYKFLMQIMETQYIAVGGIRNDNDLKNFKQKVITGVDTAKVPEGSNSASYYYFFYNAMLRFVESDWEGCRKWLKQLIDLSNKVPYELKNNDGAQINVLYYYCLLCTLSGKWEEYYNYIEQLEGVKPKSLKDVIMKFEYLYYLKFSEGRDKLNWNNFEDTYAQFEASYEQYRNSLEAQSHIGLLTQCVNYLINRKRYIEAEKWINIILINNEFKKVRIDYHLVARICDIITVFERGKSELLMYRIATTKKYLVNKDKTYKVEGKFVKYLPKIMKSKTVDDKLRLINNLRNELDALFEDERQRRVLISFDYKAYINSLLEQVHQN